MKEIPMLFSTPMVQSILEGRKTQSRRTKGLEKFNINPDCFINKNKRIEICRFSEAEKESNPNPLKVYHILESMDGFENKVECPYGKPGDLLWVRETWAPIMDINNKKPLPDAYCYKEEMHDAQVDWRWRPSIHMPKQAARIWLQLTNVKVERLQDITEEDAIAEGILKSGIRNKNADLYKNYFHNDWDLHSIESFQSLWQSINGIESWDANPWVWVVKFKVVSTTGRENVVL